MNSKRYNELMDNEELELTREEKELGWHFCTEWDFLLIGPGHEELHACSCLPRNHPIYKTMPPLPLYEPIEDDLKDDGTKMP